MGVVILGAIALYLIVSLAVVVLAARAAKKRGKSPWRWGGAATLVMYLLVFWDHIPTVVAHKYYCEKEAGFWIYKTVDQWKKENPGMMETLVANKGDPHKFEGDMANYTTTNFLNSRFNLVVKHRGSLFLHRWLREDELIDTKNNEVLARYVDFSTSQERRQAGWSGWKFWLDSRHCSGGIDNAINSGNWINQFKGMEK
ncbi:MAG: hypothetical protein ACREVA_05475 [Burkholderiales bacterium]